MSRPLKARNGRCPRDQEREQCPMQCRYNHFESGDGTTIDSWDLKCLDCGVRETIAHRSGDDSDPNLDVASETEPRCPFCGLAGLLPGLNPCQSCRNP